MKNKTIIREADVLKSVLEYLAVKNIPAVRMNTGAFKTEEGGFIRCGVRGMSDIYAVGKKGRSIWIECKQPGGRLTKYQEAFMDMINKAGGVGIVVNSVDSLDVQLKEAGVL